MNFPKVGQKFKLSLKIANYISIQYVQLLLVRVKEESHQIRPAGTQERCL